METVRIWDGKKSDPGLTSLIRNTGMFPSRRKGEELRRSARAGDWDCWMTSPHRGTPPCSPIPVRRCTAAQGHTDPCSLSGWPQLVCIRASSGRTGPLRCHPRESGVFRQWAGPSGRMVCWTPGLDGSASSRQDVLQFAIRVGKGGGVVAKGADGVQQPGLRIRIGSGFNRVSGSGFGIRIRTGIQESKNDPQK